MARDIYEARYQKYHIFKTNYKTTTMLEWIIICAVLALVFAVLGFGNIARGFAQIAKILFYILIIVLIISLISHLLG